MGMNTFNPQQLSLPFCVAAESIHKTGFDFPWNKESFESLLTLPSTIGWINENGLLVCSQVADEMEILTICIMPESRQKGLGMKWLGYLFNYAHTHNMTRIFLEVSVQNIPALRLYQKAGFVEIGRRKNYYKTHTGYVDALCMEKIIS